MATLTDFDENAVYDAIDVRNSGIFEEVGRDLILEAANDLRDIILANANGQFTTSQMSVYNHLNNMDIGNVEYGNGSLGVDLFLNGDTSRPSLNPSSSGAYDIVGLFIHGWSASKRVYGAWHGMVVGSRMQKDGMSFLSDAIDQFNAKYSGDGITATIGGNYG